MSSLSRLFSSRLTRAADPEQHRVLQAIAAGGGRFQSVVFTRNRRVIASVTDAGRTLRLQVAFREAPPEVLAAFGPLFGSPSSTERSRARRTIQEYLERVGHLHSRPPQRRRIHVPASDLPHLERLRAEFAATNRTFFSGQLPEIPVRLSGRMRRRNGHFTPDPLEIVIARQLCERGAPGEAERTMRHEMIHLWQHVAGRKLGHGADFRRWARRLDIHPRATRTVCWK